MSFGLNEEHALIRSSIREFMAGECPRDRARELDEAGAFPKDLLGKLAELGFCGLCVPEEFGGAGRDLLGTAIVVEEIAALSPVLAGGFSSIALLGGEVITTLGSRPQKERLLPDIARGALLFTHSVTAARSSTSGISTGSEVVASGPDYLLSGSEPLVGLGDYADYLLALARTKDGLRPGTGFSLFVVQLEAPGIRYEVTSTIGYRGSGQGHLSFDDVRLSEEDLLGGREQLHQGTRQARYVQAVDRLATAAAGVGIAQGAYDYAADYAKQRVQFGRPIAEFEAIQQKFADVATAIRATRLLVHEACWRADRRQPFELEAAVAAAQSTVVARQAALEALQILGGQGYMLESDVQRSLRDSLVLFSGAERISQLKCEVGALLGFGSEPEWQRPLPKQPEEE